MRFGRALAISVGALLLAGPGPALAAWPPGAPLVPLPSEKVRDLAPLLRGGTDLALLESDRAPGAEERMKQLTAITFVAAPPERVREVVIHPERYGEFVPNMSTSELLPTDDGTLIHHYALSYSVVTLDGRHRYAIPAPTAEDPTPPVDLIDPDPGGSRHFRFQFLPVPGGGTVLVIYGYAPVPDSGVMRRLLHRARLLEFGLALIPQMTLLLSVKHRAESQNGLPGQPAHGGAGGGYRFLLDRGTVAFFRTQNRRVVEVDLVDRTTAPGEVLLKVAGDPARWPDFVPTVDRVTPGAARDGGPTVEIEQSLPLFSFTTTFGVRVDGSAVDLLGLDGDLQGGRIRWDVYGREAGRTQYAVRSSIPWERGSLVLRELYKREPLFEYGVDLGLSLVLTRGVKWHAEPPPPAPSLSPAPPPPPPAH